MSIRKRILRVIIGLAVVALVLAIGVTITNQIMPAWGATSAEVARTLPGDELYGNPAVDWTHAITIRTSQAQVWGWIAQIGERRGGFYSYTFIENQMGNGNVYQNADRIVPEWQNPSVGTPIIGGALPLRISAIEPGKWMLASSQGAIGWSWLWYLEPISENQTRLLVRMKLQPADMTSNPVLGTVIGLGAFVMERAMLDGIQDRAEGNVPPSYSEALEIVVWLAALVAGVVAGVLFVAKKDWQVPLVIGVLALSALLVFTFWQPLVLTRMLLVLALWTGIIGYAVDQRTIASLNAPPRRPSGSLKHKPSAQTR